MNADNAAPTEQPGISAADQGAATPVSIMAIAADTLSITRSFVELAALESLRALQSIPKILALGAVALLLALFSWLSFCATISIWVFSVWQSATLAMGTFCAIQIFALLICRYSISAHAKNLTLPRTRAFVKQMDESIREALQKNKT